MRKTREIDLLAEKSPITIAATVIYTTAAIFKKDVQLCIIAERTGLSD